MSAAEVGIGGKSEDTVDAIRRIINKGSMYLGRWERIFHTRYPNSTHDIPPQEDLSVMNCKEAAGTTDTCNQAYKTYEVFFDQLPQDNISIDRNNNEVPNNNESEALSLSVPGYTKSNMRVDCQHHIRNVWSGAVTTNWCNYVKVDLAEDLKDIDLRLRVEIDMSSIV